MPERPKPEPEEPRPRPLDEPAPTGEPRLDALARLIAVVDRLRAPDGCPWDREQTTVSLAPSLVEEAHELLEALEARSDADAVEEAGDLLMVVALVCRIAQDEERFDLSDAARAVAEKLVRRHPHVFGSAAARDAAHVAARWEEIKREERRAEGRDASALAGVPAALPALQRAQRVGRKAIAAGFRWADANGALSKLREEVEELSAAFADAGAGDRAPGDLDAAARARMEEELGDVCFAAAQLASYLDLDPERATREAVRRFETRFRRMETELGDGRGSADLATWMAAWRRAKAAEGPGGERP